MLSVKYQCVLNFFHFQTMFLKNRLYNGYGVPVTFNMYFTTKFAIH